MRLRGYVDQLLIDSGEIPVVELDELPEDRALARIMRAEMENEMKRRP